MSHSLPNLTRRTATLAVAGLVVMAAAGWVFWRAWLGATPPRSAAVVVPAVAVEPTPRATRVVRHSTSDADAAGAGEGRGTADDLLAQSLARLDGVESLSAQLRQRVEAFGTTLSGSGRYLQGSPASRTWRLELKLVVGAEIGSLKQISDGQVLWTHSQVHDHERLTRVDLAATGQGGSAALASLDAAAASEQPAADAQGWLGAGGLPRLVRMLADDVAWRQPRLVELAGRVAWHLEGTWRPEFLRRLAAEGVTDGARPLVDWSRVPLNVPQRTSLWIDRELRLPSRLEFTRDDPPRRAAAEFGATATRSRVVIEWFDYELDQPLATSWFQYHPGEQAWLDETARYQPPPGK